ncbi:hypothetical protein JF737_15920 [Mycobacterium avium]|uniref:hypothetical protein n=1 Tax=Mycobacterium avium TaxID=1764 RepID=UPI001CD991E5|nr:hypothetical protein [Mycobacterium avium]MCA2238137.1 hypothetical protein [Mycobacterium avium]MCA2259156.1 hypothetical protein [Mycobacterium avium]MCA2270070.1 hypothetical protein [Mycobacterium avium]MCA2290052.1 hypothetical protein [Mycobacterium avium]MCA2300152.1 hypothetical protein [Mycobacterium avium]
MTVEQVVDDYLKGVREIVGTTPAPTTPTSPSPSTLPEFPSADWTGNAHDAAIAAGTSLQLARQNLNTAAGGVATATESANRIAGDATTQLDVIAGEWEHAKAAAGVLPSPGPRDAALMPQAQMTIGEAVVLISATTAKYADAAAEVRKHTATLPNQTPAQKQPDRPEGDGGAPPSPGLSTTATPGPDVALAGAAPMPTGPMDGPGGANSAPTAAMSNMLPAAAGMIPAAMGMPAAFMPMASALPAGAAPLGGMLSPFMQAAAGSPSPSTTATGGAEDIPSSGAQPSEHTGQPRTIREAIDGALDALGITDPQARQRWQEGYQTLIERESSGRVHAIANGDSNAVGPMMADGGHRGSSRGLAQVTPSTFEAFWVPGTSKDIFDPVANIAASMNYVISDPKYHVSPSGVDLATKIAQANPRSQGGGY